jgi:hypothetical protein
VALPTLLSVDGVPEPPDGIGMPPVGMPDEPDDPDDPDDGD